MGKKAESLDELTRRVRDAWHAQFRQPPIEAPMEASDSWPRDVFTDKVIVEQPDGLWSYPYTIEDDKIVFGEPSKVEVDYKPRKGMDDQLIMFGGAVKALGDGKVGGYLVRFTSADEPDLEGEFFDAKTDYGIEPGAKTPVYLNHRMPLRARDGKSITVKEQIGEGTLSLDDGGIIIDAILYNYELYSQALDKMGWTSGTAPHLVDREDVGKAIHLVKWPLGLDASISPTPADPGNRAMPLKAWAESVKGLEMPLETEPAGQENPQEGDVSGMTIQAESVNVTINQSTPVEEAKTEVKKMSEKVETPEQVETPEPVDVEAVIKQAVEETNKAWQERLENEPPINNPGHVVTEVNDEADRALKGNPFKSMGEQLVAIRNAAYGNIDKRLLPLRAKAILGATGTIASDGGFLIGTEQDPGLDKKVFDSGVFAGRINLRTLSAGTNSADFYGITEDSRATGSRFGGIRGYRVAEGATITASQLEYSRYTLKPNKYAILAYVTDEALNDQNLLEQEIMDAAPKELAFMLDDDILNGVAAGYPRGVLQADCLVAVAKETDQGADTIMAENIVKMWARRWTRGSYTWFINQNVLPQLYLLNVGVGTGGQLVFMPPGGISGAPYATLLGAPVVETEFSAGLGDQGDIVLADFSQYKVAQAGTMKAASSIHVEFLTDQTAYRFTARYDGQSTWRNALTPYKGTGDTQSPFVTLAERA